MRIFLFLLILVIPSIAFSQQSKIELVGEIIDAETKDAVPYVHIINKHTQEGVASNTEGRFWIRINPGDTLLFSAIGFETYQFVINERVTTDKMLVTIALSQATLELESVKVFAYKDEYALKRAILDAEVPMEDEKKGIELPGFYYGPRKEWKNSAFTSPLTAIAGVFSKENKERKLLAQAEKNTHQFQQLEAKYNEQVVKEITGLPDDKIEDFMEFCVIDRGFIEKATEYEITVVIHQCLTDFKNQPEK
ncbi:carboxypeptidase-like regulatory domain-containing protein [Fulvivirga lutea]|uniref:Carboxypeptidase-like regulatory domain-containing protein n=1 Tax=Fulvivirga lutea TaxID=2810512 RepID=A0A974WGX3_9BACT|nr:carboxypeptidase-like regulatory domain-containing protein [Fulvivirga lutea]QSE95885.1 carboxypeptidase-like regulatory domain-containing protein [Fulvivirga lutea]